MIYYRDMHGGRLNQPAREDGFAYQPPPKAKLKPVIRKDVGEALPPEGFFAIECIGKNRIFVDGLRVEHGDVAMIKSGSTIKMNSYQLIFLLPEDAPRETMSVPLFIPGLPPVKRKKPAASAPSAGGGGATSVITGPKRISSVTNAHEEASVKKLLNEFFEAIENNQWDRKHQMISGAITLHACKDAARSPAVQAIDKKNSGVSRSEIMDWIKKSKRYSKWVHNNLNKVEIKSYQANITKCMWKAGYKRNAPVGRFVRWTLPSMEELGPGDPMDEDEVCLVCQ
jgi:hypothetical protein